MGLVAWVEGREATAQVEGERRKKKGRTKIKQHEEAKIKRKKVEHEMKRGKEANGTRV